MYTFSCAVRCAQTHIISIESPSSNWNHTHKHIGTRWIRRRKGSLQLEAQWVSVLVERRWFFLSRRKRAVNRHHDHKKNTKRTYNLVVYMVNEKRGRRHTRSKSIVNFRYRQKSGPRAHIDFSLFHPLSFFFVVVLLCINILYLISLVAEILANAPIFKRFARLQNDPWMK